MVNKKEFIKSPIALFFAGGFLASILFLLLYGVDVVNPTYDGWLYNGINKTDLIQHYYGWRFYRNSSWSFPLGMLEGLTYPDKLSIIYTDSIPLFALFFKVLSPVLPDIFQYLGLFGLISFFLMGGFSSLCINHYTHNSFYSILSSVFFDLCMILLIRVFYHTALSAQWIIVASIYFFIDREKDWNIKKSIIYWGILGVIAISTQAYFYPMVMGIMLCSLLNNILVSEEKKKSLIRFIVVPAISIISAIITGWIFGAFSSTVSTEGSGLGDYSFNYNGLFNTFGYTYVLKQLPSLGWGQYEGYCYLGIGLYLLLFVDILVYVISLSKHKEKKCPSLLKKMIPYILYVVCFTFFAAGPLFSFGEKRVDYNLPVVFTKIWSMFRSTGRFIWPVVYLAIVFICTETYKIYKNKNISFLLLSAALCIHVLEISPHVASIQNHYLVNDYSYVSSLVDPKWDELAGACKHIVLYPNVSKLYWDWDAQVKGQELMIYAEKNDMTINANYVARDISSKVNEDVYETFKNGTLDNNTIYVFLDETPEDTCGLYIYTIDGITIGTLSPLE